VQVLAVTLRDFRSYEDVRAPLGEGLTVVSGPNGAGKTNLLEAIYFGCTGRSCRTRNEREMVRFGAPLTRVVVEARAEDGEHELSVGFAPGEAKRMQFDGSSVERLLDLELRPLVSVFLPDRLELIKGAPALRRAHLDQFVAALWPARITTRRAYTQALVQRNALIAQVRSGTRSRALLAPWDQQLARYGIALMADRSAAVRTISNRFSRVATELGLGGEAALIYHPRSKATSAEELARELAERVDSDLERGFTGHGPHRDDLLASHRGRDLRSYGSQGQQRLALLALLLAEREAIAAQRDGSPLMLLDDVMSELDGERRQALAVLLRSGGQAVVSTTDVEHVPGVWEGDITRIEVRDGRLMLEAVEA
jgi:DNA replication and repair protein RecF